MKIEKEKDLLEHLLELAEKNEDNSINLESVKTSINSLNTIRFLEYIVEYFKKINIIDVIERENKVDIINKKQLISEIKILLGEGEPKDIIKDNVIDVLLDNYPLDDLVLKKDDSQNRYIPLVISYPPSLNDKMRTLIKKYKNLQIFSFGKFLHYAFAKAEEEVLICNPYIEIEGILYIFSDLGELVEKGIKLKILTRDLIDRESKSFRNEAHNKIKGLTKIFELYNSRNKLDLIDVKDFSSGFRIHGAQSRLYESIHQKMIIIDDKLCYIGSGEIRPSSLYNNGDLGCIFNDKNYLNFFKNYFYVFWDSHISYEIKFDELRNFLKI